MDQESYILGIPWEIFPKLLFISFLQTSFPVWHLLPCVNGSPCRKGFTSCSVWFFYPRGYQLGQDGCRWRDGCGTLCFWKTASFIFNLPDRKNYLIHKLLWGFVGVFLPHPSIIVCPDMIFMNMKAVTEAPVHCSGSLGMKAVNSKHQCKSSLTSEVLQVLELAYN